MKKHTFIVTALAGLLFAADARPESPRHDPIAPQCTVFAVGDSTHFFVAKNLDWALGAGMVMVNPSGAHKRARAVASIHPAEWTSRFSSLTFNQFGLDFPVGGMNEVGLVVEELSYAPTEYPTPDERAAVSELQWIQYQLDSSRTVRDVVSSLADIRIAPLLFGLHYFVADAQGNAAVVEFLDGRPVVYAGDDLPVRVLANENYENLLRYLGFHEGFGGDRRPGDGPESPERFARAAAWLQGLDLGAPRGASLAACFALMEDLAQEDTQWSIVYEPTSQLVHYRTARNPGVRRIWTGAFATTCTDSALARPIDPASESDPWEVWTQEKNERWLEDVFRALEGLGMETPSDSVREELMRLPVAFSDPVDPIPELDHGGRGTTVMKGALYGSIFGGIFSFAAWVGSNTIGNVEDGPSHDDVSASIIPTGALIGAGVGAAVGFLFHDDLSQTNSPGDGSLSQWILSPRLLAVTVRW